MTLRTPVEKLPQWKGRPVPWVARWSGEIAKSPAQVARTPDGQVVVLYERGELRDDHGVLWISESPTREGVPEYAQVSAWRQRSCMLNRLCQVCGEQIESRLIRWLIDPRQIHTMSNAATATMSPPTCDGCIPLALDLCPAMKKSHRIAKVLEYRVIGVYGTVVRYGPENQPQQTEDVLIEYDRKDYPFAFTQVVARQQVVEWTKFLMED